MTNVSAFFSEFLGTALLLIGLLAFTDGKNHPLPKGLLPLALFILFVGIGSSWGMETGTACSLVLLSPIQSDCQLNRLRY
jgi:aquaglyceroporin related protein